MKSSKANRIPFCNFADVVGVIAGVALLIAICVSLLGCTVVMANRSNVNTTTTTRGPARSGTLQDSKPSGGGSLSLPISPNEKGPESR